MGPKATEFGEITQNNGNCAVQGHSRSPILVPIECDFLLVINTNSPPILHHHCIKDAMLLTYKRLGSSVFYEQRIQFPGPWPKFSPGRSVTSLHVVVIKVYYSLYIAGHHLCTGLLNLAGSVL